MPEAPKYRLTTNSYVEGVGVLEQGVEYDLPESIPPRNSWIPLNEAANEAFKKRDAATLAESHARIVEVKGDIDAAKEAGATDDELAGLHAQMSALRVEHASLPRKLKLRPNFGPSSSARPQPVTPAVVEPAAVKPIPAPPKAAAKRASDA